VTDYREKGERFDTKRKKKFGKIKNEVERYGQAERLNGCNKLQTLMQKRRKKKLGRR
jgi:hypothetical protein